MSSSVSNSTITFAPGGAGRGGNAGDTTREDQGGRGRGAWNRNRNNNRAAQSSGVAGDATRPARTSGFKGATEGMNGHTFGCFDEQGDKRQYVKTVEALSQYANKTYKFSEDFSSLFLAEATAPVLEKPKPPPKEGCDETDDLIFKEQIKQYVNRCSTLKGNLAAIWSVAIGQCTETMKAKLVSIKKYDDKHRESDCNWLLKSILSITLQFDNKRYGYLAVMEAHQRFLNCCKQQPNQTLEEYRQQLTLWSDTIEHHDGSIVENYLLVSPTNSIGTVVRTAAERKEAARQETLAMALLRGADQSKYGTLLDHLGNQCASGRDEYPKDLQAAYSLLAYYRTPTNISSTNRARSDHGNGNSNNNASNKGRNGDRAEAPAAGGATFAQTDSSPVVPSDPAQGSFSVSVPSASIAATVTTIGTTLVQNAVMMAQAELTNINPNWILLDSQTTLSVLKTGTCSATCATVHMSYAPLQTAVSRTRT